MVLNPYGGFARLFTLITVISYVSLALATGATILLVMPMASLQLSVSDNFMQQKISFKIETYFLLIFKIGTNINKIIDDNKVTIKLLVNVFKKSITVKLLIIISGK